MLAFFLADLPLLLISVVLGLLAALSGLFTAAFVEAQYPMGAEASLVVRGAPDGESIESFEHRIAPATAFLAEYGTFGARYHPADPPEHDLKNWSLPLAPSVHISEPTRASMLTGVWKLEGSPAEVRAASAALDEAGYEVVSDIRRHDLRAQPWFDDTGTFGILLGMAGAVFVAVLLALNRRVKARALAYSLGVNRAWSLARDVASILLRMFGVMGAIGTLGIFAVSLWSPAAIVATEFVSVYAVSFFLAGVTALLMTLGAALVSELAPIPTVQRLREVAPQAPVIAASFFTAAALVTGALLASSPLLGSVEVSRNAAETLRAWDGAPEVTAVSLFALSDSAMNERTSALRSIVDGAESEGVAILGNTATECDPESGADPLACVIRTNDAFFTVTDQSRQEFGLPFTSSRTTLTVAIPDSKWRDREVIVDDAQAWAAFESIADCEVAGVRCGNREPTPTVTAVRYESGKELQSFLSNAAGAGEPTALTDPVIYDYSPSASWVSSVNTLADISHGGLYFRLTPGETRERFADAGIADIVSSASSAKESAMVAAEEAQRNAALRALRGVSIIAAAVFSAAALAVADAERQRARLFAAFVLGRGFLTRHYRLLLLMAGALLLAVLAAYVIDGLPGLGALVINTCVLAVTMGAAAGAALRFDSRLSGSTVKER